MLHVPPSIFALLFSLYSFSPVFLLLILGPCNRKHDIGEGKGKDCDRRVLCGCWRKWSNWMLCIAAVDRMYCWCESLSLLARWGSFISGECERNLVRLSESDLSVDRELEGMTVYICIYAVVLSVSHFIHAWMKSSIQEPSLLKYYALSLVL
jgi:hypothetical protein